MVSFPPPNLNREPIRFTLTSEEHDLLISALQTHLRYSSTISAFNLLKKLEFLKPFTGGACRHPAHTSELSLQDGTND